MRPLSERADALNEQHLYKKTKTKKTNGHKKGAKPRDAESLQDENIRSVNRGEGLIRIHRVGRAVITGGVDGGGDRKR